MQAFFVLMMELCVTFFGLIQKKLRLGVSLLVVRGFCLEKIQLQNGMTKIG